jgi:hypothetical protein
MGTSSEFRDEWQTYRRATQCAASSNRGRTDLLYTGDSEVHRLQHGSGSLHENRISASIFHRAFCRDLRDSVRPPTPSGAVDEIVSIPLLIVITTAITTTKIPELFRANQGFWYMVSDARTDFAMFCCLVFLISVGGGNWSFGATLSKHT